MGNSGSVLFMFERKGVFKFDPAKLNLDKMVTRFITLDQVEEAFHEMETGNVIRSVIKI